MGEIYIQEYCGRNTPQHLGADKSLLRACLMKPLTVSKEQITLTCMTLGPELYKSLRQNIEADFDAQIRELEVRRHKAIEVLNEAWPKMGGSEEDLRTLAAELEASTKDTVASSGEAVSQSNGSTGRTIPMKVVQDEVESYLSGTDTQIVTQTEIKDRLLSKYPNAKVPSIRSAISHFLSGLVEQGELELIEKGRAGKPNRYRKTAQKEAKEEEPETGVFALRSGP